MTTWRVCKLSSYAHTMLVQPFFAWFIDSSYLGPVNDVFEGCPFFFLRHGYWG
jgi:hypothetical protein